MDRLRCPDCGDCCAKPYDGPCAGSYEGICHKVWVETFGTEPWKDDRAWEYGDIAQVVPSKSDNSDDMMGPLDFASFKAGGSGATRRS